MTSRYPPTKNQLRNSSNLRTQDTIQNGQVMVQNVQGRQSQGYAVNTRKNQATGARVVNTVREESANHQGLEKNDDCNDLQLHITTNFKANHVDAYDLDYDNKATASAIFMASLSPAGSITGDIVGPIYDSNILSEVPHYDTYHETDVLN
nr:hypothetical protein [Tanacetum cinerariifolium]